MVSVHWMAVRGKGWISLRARGGEDLRQAPLGADPHLSFGTPLGHVHTAHCLSSGFWRKTLGRKSCHRNASEAVGERMTKAMPAS